MINGIIGSGIFKVPGDLMALLGRASPLAMIVAGLLMSIIMLCMAEVASQFSEAGGVYLYSRAAFGRLIGLQVGWFWFLSVLGGAAASANLFAIYLTGFAPWAAHGWPRLLVITGLIALPAAANYRGTRQGAVLSNVFTVAKLAPLVLLIGLGLLRFSRNAEWVPLAEVTTPGWAGWGTALLMLVFAFAGWEDAPTAAGEIMEPQRTIPRALITSLAACIVIYTLLQFVVAATPGTGASPRPLAAAAEAFLGRGGAWFVGMAAMISTYGWISASMLNAPRMLFSWSAQSDFPAVFARLHPRFNTPYAAVVVFAVLAWALAASNSFEWSLLVSAGAGTLFYGVVCAAVLRLRYLRPGGARFRLPFGPLFSVTGVAICLALLGDLDLRKALLMSITALVAGLNWWWARRRAERSQEAVRLRIPQPEASVNPE
jgi:amino acid transporter